ncbi:MAG: protein tyrosine phosphatase [Microbacterium sp. SCN 70-18]|nr:MAG: protein tyrosine phosphatase [Microbacterium sp. SCN 70-18]
MNLRDVGGLRAGGGITRERTLYRSGTLAHLADDGVAALSRLSLRRVVDLRDAAEVPVERVPLFLGSVTSFFAEDIGLEEMYRRIVDDSSDAVVRAVRAVVVDQPVLVHCTVGKDRTGVTVAVALSAAGVDRDEVVADYARTAALLPVERTRAVIDWLRAQHPGSTNLEQLVAGSPADVMERLLGRIDAEYGSARDYLLAHGLSDDEVVELGRVLVAR